MYTTHMNESSHIYVVKLWETKEILQNLHSRFDSTFIYHLSLGPLFVLIFYMHDIFQTVEVIMLYKLEHSLFAMWSEFPYLDHQTPPTG